MNAQRYDHTGLTYLQTRQPDPRIADRINIALAGMASVVNVGAGTGSYEPTQTVLAVEPSRVMIAQRRAPDIPCGGPGPAPVAPAIQARAEQLPVATKSVDAALAVLTVHHWTDWPRGLSELARIARRRIVVLTWDHNLFRQFWLLQEYLPAAAETDRRLSVPIDELRALLPRHRVEPVAVPHDCVDGFGGAYWRRPHAYLDPTVRAGMSMLALTPHEEVEAGLDRLRLDIDSGAWSRRHQDIQHLAELDLGYRLVIADLSPRVPGSAAVTADGRATQHETSPAQLPAGSATIKKDGGQQ
ncbi:class I SAM-dependent methyltransferase [Mycobacterium sp. AMU20-3851]|uniref:class I SAM-dependent methyltransferase n=1 Tax=Mycobacterium sp. AMU20-3851 TaxID=3122055 RepID=UPI00375452A2